MLDSVFSLLGGLVLAGVGGEFFVRGVVGIARWARVPAGIVAVSVAAFATSSPELSVSVSSALAGNPSIGLGDAIGSNVVNIAFILGAALLLGDLKVDRGTLRRDLAAAIGAPVLTGLLLLDGELSRLDGAVLLVVFVAWLTFVVIDAWRERSAVGILGEQRHGLALLTSVVGLAMLVLAGRLIVTGASAIGEAAGLSPFVVGTTIVAIGTSVPELATTVISRWRGHEEVGLGTVLGSNVFNGLFIVGVAASIHPIAVGDLGPQLGLAFGVATVLLAVPTSTGLLTRWRGVALLLSYAAFLGVQLWQGGGH
ncbi:MAG: calcium/sodium antiporter [Myxococcaceae bacterium]|nr:calcium/sodium antiporter [Myxococcaceae bacterium]